MPYKGLYVVDLGYTWDVGSYVWALFMSLIYKPFRMCAVLFSSSSRTVSGISCFRLRIQSITLKLPTPSFNYAAIQRHWISFPSSLHAWSHIAYTPVTACRKAHAEFVAWTKDACSLQEFQLFMHERLAVLHLKTAGKLKIALVGIGERCESNAWAMA